MFAFAGSLILYETASRQEAYQAVPNLRACLSHICSLWLGARVDLLELAPIMFRDSELRGPLIGSSGLSHLK